MTIPREILMMTLPAVVSAVLLLFALLWQGRRCRSLQRQVEQLLSSAAAPRAVEAEAEPEQAPAMPTFAGELQQIERSQTPPRRHQTAELPERYRYVGALARQGLNAAQIASTLQIGEGEAAQILRLVRLGTPLPR